MYNISFMHKLIGEYEKSLEYMNKSLNIFQEINDTINEVKSLNEAANICRLHKNYNIAINYLQRSFIIQQAIGDMAGLCMTLFNMGHIHWQNEEVAEAMQAWVTVYGIAKQINLANVLQALENMAGQLGLESGLQGWEILAQQMNAE